MGWWTPIEPVTFWLCIQYLFEALTNNTNSTGKFFSANSRYSSSVFTQTGDEGDVQFGSKSIDHVHHVCDIGVLEVAEDEDALLIVVHVGKYDGISGFNLWRFLPVYWPYAVMNINCLL